MFGGASIPLWIFNPTLGQWRLYTGDLDTDHAYKSWGRIDFDYYGCHATVDQRIELETTPNDPTPRTHWVGTARNHSTHTDGWKIARGSGAPVSLSEAVSQGWISENMAYFDNVTGTEVAFTVEDGASIHAWNGVKIQVLTSDKLTIIVPR